MSKKSPSDPKTKQQDALLTQEVHDTIVRAVRLGNYSDIAAAHAGIHRQVFMRWMRQGASDKKGKFHELYKEVNKALADAEVADLAIIKKASQTQWQAAAWRLERRYKDRWGRNTIELTGKDGGPISHEHTAIVQMIGKVYGKIAEADGKDQEST